MWRLVAVFWVSLLLLGSGYVEFEHDCTRADHRSNCPICWSSYSSGDIADSDADSPILPVQLAKVLPAPRPVFSLPLLSSDSRAPPAA